MRMTTILMGLCLAVAFVITTSASAQTQQGRPAGAAGGPGLGGTMAPPATTVKPTGPANPIRVPGGVKVAPLTEGECTKLGGDVHIDIHAVCISGKYCLTTDEHQEKHFVCISKN
jgi:hypothetical protein